MPDNSGIDMRLASIANSLEQITSSLQSNIGSATNAGILAGAGYGGYKLMTSQSQPAQMARSAGGYMAQGVHSGAQALNVTPGSWQGTLGTRARNYDGYTDQGNVAMQHGAMDITNRVTTNLSSTALGIGALGATGLARKGLAATGVSGLTGAAGKVAGTGAMKAAGVGVGTGLGMLGIPGAGKIGSAIGSLSGVAGTVGGIAGGMLPGALAGAGIFRAGTEISRNIGAQRNIEDIMREQSFRITPGEATNPLTREGFGYEDQRDLAQSARGDLVDEEYLRQGDFEDIFDTMMENNMLFDVRGREDLEQKFEEVTENVKDITRFYNTTLEGGVELMAEMQDAGFFETEQQAEALMESRMIGRRTGMTGQEIVQIGKQGSRVAEQMGLNPQMGYRVQTEVTENLVGAERQMDEETRQRYQEDIELAGGREQVVSEIGQFELGLAQDEQLKTMIFGMVEDGELDNETLSRFADGEIDYQEMYSRGAARRSEDIESYLEYQQDYHRYYDQLTEREDYRDISRGFIEAVEELKFRNVDAFGLKETLEHMGLTGRTRDLYMDMFEYGPEGSELDFETQRSREVEERVREASPRGMWERFVAHPSEQVMNVASMLPNRMATDFRSGVQNMVEDIAGVERISTTRDINFGETNVDLDELSDLDLLDDPGFFDAISSDEYDLSDTTSSWDRFLEYIDVDDIREQVGRLDEMGAGELDDLREDILELGADELRYMMPQGEVGDISYEDILEDRETARAFQNILSRDDFGELGDRILGHEARQEGLEGDEIGMLQRINAHHSEQAGEAVDVFGDMDQLTRAAQSATNEQATREELARAVYTSGLNEGEVMIDAQPDSSPLLPEHSSSEMPLEDFIQNFSEDGASSRELGKDIKSLFGSEEVVEQLREAPGLEGLAEAGEAYAMGGEEGLEHLGLDPEEVIRDESVGPSAPGQPQEDKGRIMDSVLEDALQGQVRDSGLVDEDHITVADNIGSFGEGQERTIAEFSEDQMDQLMEYFEKDDKIDENLIKNQQGIIRVLEEYNLDPREKIDDWGR